MEQIKDIFYNIFQSVAERDTTTGDEIEIYILKSTGELYTERLPLRRD